MQLDWALIVLDRMGLSEVARGQSEERRALGERRTVAVDRRPALALLVGIWWGLWAAGTMGSAAHRCELGRITGPDWDLHHGAFLRESPVGEASRGSPPEPEPYPRRLRQARGIGRTRSLDLTRYYAAEGAEAPADALRGVGEAMARAAREQADILRAEYVQWFTGPGAPGDEVPARGRRE